MSNAVSAALTTALAGLVGGRVHEMRMPDKPIYPCIRYLMAGSNPDTTLLGEASCTTWRYRLDVYARTAKEAGQVVASARSIMRGFAYPALPVMEVEGYEPILGICRRTIDFNVVEQQ